MAESRLAKRLYRIRVGTDSNQCLLDGKLGINKLEQKKHNIRRKEYEGLYKTKQVSIKSSSTECKFT